MARSAFDSDSAEQVGELPEIVRCTARHAVRPRNTEEGLVFSDIPVAVGFTLPVQLRQCVGNISERLPFDTIIRRRDQPKSPRVVWQVKSCAGARNVSSGNL